VSGPFQVAPDIQDDNVPASVVYRINGGPSQSLSAPYAFEVDPVKALPPGGSTLLYIEVTATDVAGRVATNSRVFNYVPPPKP
jgi:hypothetical protein